MRTFVLLFLAAATVLCSAANAGQIAPVRVGLTLSRTEDMAEAEAMYAQGLALWAAQINAKGGLLGRPVELVILDDGGDPGRAAQAYAAMSRGGQADLLLGPLNANLAQACLPALMTSGTPCVFPMTSSDILWEQGHGLAFGMQPPLSEWSLGFFEVAARAHLHSIALVAVDMAGREALPAAARWAKRYGMAAVQATVAQENLTAVLEQAGASGAEGLLLWCPPRGCKTALQAVKRQPWRPKAVFVSCEQCSSGFPQSLGKDAEGVFTAVPWNARAAQAFPGGAEFIAAFRTKYSRDPTHYAASAFAGGQVLEAAVAKARSLEPGPIRTALAGLDLMTIIGRYGVAPSGMQLRQFPLTLQWVRGKTEIVWPEAMRTARPVTG